MEKTSSRKHPHDRIFVFSLRCQESETWAQRLNTTFSKAVIYSEGHIRKSLFCLICFSPVRLIAAAGRLD